MNKQISNHVPRIVVLVLLALVLLSFLFGVSSFAAAPKPGALDNNFGLIPGITKDNLSQVLCMAPLSNGKVLVGGLFNSINGNRQHAIVRLNTDGSLDTSFDTGAGANYAVETIAVQKDGRILISGSFWQYNGQSRPGLARLNNNGNLDPTFNPGTGVDGPIRQIVVLPNDQLLIVGSFSHYNEEACPYLARLNSDGSLDNGFHLGIGLDIEPFAVGVQSDGKILIGGGIVAGDGSLRGNLIRLTLDGTADSSFGPPPIGDDLVQWIAVQSDNKILVTCSHYADAESSFKLIRLSADGTQDQEFAPIMPPVPYNLALALEPDDELLVLDGLFVGQPGNENQSRFALGRVTKDGILNPSLVPELIIEGGIAPGSRLLLASANDGKIFIGGDFTSVNGKVRNRIARFNTNGTLDLNFDPDDGTGLNLGEIFASVRRTDGKIWIGGSFSPSSGARYHNIARLNADGSLDSNVPTTLGANGPVFTMLLQSNNQVVIGGWFSQINGVSRKSLARLNADGSLDTSFQPNGEGFSDSTDARVYTLGRLPDGRIFAGGDRTVSGGNTQPYLVRVNPDGSFGTNVVSDNEELEVQWISVTAVQPDGKILVAGAFTKSNDTDSYNLVRVNLNGMVDWTFTTNAGSSNGFMTISALALQNDHRILVGGEPQSSQPDKTGLFRLNEDGTPDPSFNPVAIAPFPQNPSSQRFYSQYVTMSIWSVAVQSDGKTLVGGGFTGLNGTARSGIARLNPDGSLDMKFNQGSGTDWPVETMLIQPDGQILIGGVFSSYNGIAKEKIARLKTDGSLDTTFNRSVSLLPGPSEPFPGTTYNNSAIWAMASYKDGRILIGGDYTHVNHTPKNHLARLLASGSLDTSFFSSLGVSGPVFAIARLTNEQIVIAGLFSYVDGIRREGIARLNSDGRLDASFNPGTGVDAPGAIFSIISHAGGGFLVGGSFARIQGNLRNGLARLQSNGSLDPSFDAHMGTNSIVYSMAVQANGKAVIGGAFTNVNGAMRNHITRLNSDGTLDPSFDADSGADNTVSSIVLQSDGKILIGGLFQSIKGLTHRQIARLQSNGDLDRTFDARLTGSVWEYPCLALQRNGYVLMSGSGLSAADDTLARVIRLDPTGLIDTGFDTYWLGGASVYCVEVQDNGSILLGGNFQTPGHNGIARIFGGESDPMILQQPQDCAVSIGGSAILTVTASGTTALSYQWQFNNGTKLAGATNATLMISPITEERLGDYRVIVRNSVGWNRSLAARIFLGQPPNIYLQPLDQVALEGGEVTFSVRASGIPDPTFFWQRNGTAIAGAIESQLKLTNVTAQQAGTYTAVVSNSLGQVSSRSAVLTVVPAEPLNEVLGTPYWTWSVGGDALWTNSSTPDGFVAARSGAISDNQQTWIATVLKGPGTLTFRWAVSSQDHGDYLQFYIDGIQRANISGEVDWRLLAFDIPAGFHRLQWIYGKNSFGIWGADAGWLREVYYWSSQRPLPPQLDLTAEPKSDLLQLTLSGCQPDNRITILASTNLIQWSVLEVFRSTNATISLSVTGTNQHGNRFFKAIAQP
jgi:uncharacterized delta-60 repeat protein